MSPSSPNATLLAAQVQFAAGEPEPFDLLVVADGVHSVARNLLAKSGAISVSQTPDDMAYKVVALPRPATPAPDGPSAGEGKGAAGRVELHRCFHTWPATQPVTMLAPPNPDGTLSGVLILPPKARTESRSREEDPFFHVVTTEFPFCAALTPRLPPHPVVATGPLDLGVRTVRG